MIFTENFRRQHVELLELVKKLSALLSPSILSGKAQEARMLLSTLAGKITIHVSTEDSVLYPKISNHKSDEVRTLAKKYINEMGNIKEAFAAYSKKWYSAAEIQTKPDEFIKETKLIFDALGKRIDRENNELYPLVDRLEE